MVQVAVGEKRTKASKIASPSSAKNDSPDDERIFQSFSHSFKTRLFVKRPKGGLLKSFSHNNITGNVIFNARTSCKRHATNEQAGCEMAKNYPSDFESRAVQLLLKSRDAHVHRIKKCHRANETAQAIVYAHSIILDFYALWRTNQPEASQDDAGAQPGSLTGKEVLGSECSGGSRHL